LFSGKANYVIALMDGAPCGQSDIVVLVSDLGRGRQDHALSFAGGAKEVNGFATAAELDLASLRRYDGLPEPIYPLQYREVLVTACGRPCLHRKRINISTMLAGQKKFGIKEVDAGRSRRAVNGCRSGAMVSAAKRTSPSSRGIGPGPKEQVDEGAAAFRQGRKSDVAGRR
jgi:hypothetical protein